jgi:hypothetical protein
MNTTRLRECINTCYVSWQLRDHDSYVQGTNAWRDAGEITDSLFRELGFDRSLLICWTLLNSIVSSICEVDPNLALNTVPFSEVLESDYENFDDIITVLQDQLSGLYGGSTFVSALDYMSMSLPRYPDGDQPTWYEALTICIGGLVMQYGRYVWSNYDSPLDKDPKNYLCHPEFLKAFKEKWMLIADLFDEHLKQTQVANYPKME